MIEEFVDYYNEFARGKRVEPLERSYVERQCATGALVLSRVRDAEHTLVWHSHVHIGARACLRHSASLFRGQDKGFRSLVGRANRWLHLRDMVFFKGEGCTLYDFGGWYAGTEDQQRLMINRFKEGFGGQKALQYNSTLNRTRRAKLLKSVGRLVRRA